LKEKLTGPEVASAPHSEVEKLLEAEGREVLRVLFQSHLSLRSEAEPEGVVVGQDDFARTHARDGTGRHHGGVAHVADGALGRARADTRAETAMRAEFHALTVEGFSPFLGKTLVVFAAGTAYGQEDRQTCQPRSKNGPRDAEALPCRLGRRRYGGGRRR